MLRSLRPLLCLALLFLVGCQPPPPPAPPPEPTLFGMPQSQWQSLSKDQQKEVIKGYNKQQEIAEETAAQQAEVQAQAQAQQQQAAVLDDVATMAGNLISEKMQK